MLPKVTNFRKKDVLNIFKVHVVRLKTGIGPLASSDDIFVSFKYLAMKKGTQKVETSDLHLIYLTK